MSYNKHRKSPSKAQAFFLVITVTWNEFNLVVIRSFISFAVSKNLTVFPENMIRNMNSTFGLIFSQRAMLTLIEKGMTREQAYDLVQPKTAYSWDNQVDFKPLLEADPEVTSRLTQEEIDEIFNPVYYTKRVDDIFDRLGLGD